MLRLLLFVCLFQPFLFFAQSAQSYYGHLQIENRSFWGPGGIVQDKENNLYVAGLFHIPFISTRHLFITSLDKTGAVRWSKRYISNLNLYDEAKLDLLPDGSIIVAWTASFPYQAGIFKINTDGDLLWSKKFSNNPVEVEAMLVVGEDIMVAGSNKKQTFAA